MSAKPPLHILSQYVDSVQVAQLLDAATEAHISLKGKSGHGEKWEDGFLFGLQHAKELVGKLSGAVPLTKADPLKLTILDKPKE